MKREWGHRRGRSQGVTRTAGQNQRSLADRQGALCGGSSKEESPQACKSQHLSTELRC